MIPNNVAVAEVTNNLGGVKHVMKFDPDPKSMAMLMGLLTDLYSNTELACLREYATNAADAHRDAGQTRPIEITTPTALFPFLRIKDFGTGMNADTIELVYSLYGRSTKREDTTANGSMGIGGKAALAYTNSFSVTAVMDSIKTHISVSRDGEGAGVMEVVDESLTDEPNGVEILIPAKRYNSIGDEATKFFRFWKPGTVLLNGKDPSWGLTKVTDRIYLIDDASRYSDDMIVMGNVAYPVKDSLSSGDDIHHYSRRVKLAAYVTMNTPDEIVFTPSREALNYTTQTKTTIEGIIAEYRAAIVKQVQDAMTNAASYGEAFSEYIKLRRLYSTTILANIKYKGHDMPEGYVKVDAAPDANGLSTGKVRARATSWNMSATRHSVDTRRDLTYDSLTDALVVTNYPFDKGVSAGHKAKIREYKTQTGLIQSKAIFLPDDKIPGSPWTDNVSVVDWEVIRAIKMPKTAPDPYRYNGSVSYAGGYAVLDTNTGTYPTRHDLKKTDKIIYYSKGKEAGYGGELKSAMRDMFAAYLPDYLIVEAGTGRHEKLLRLFPSAITIYAAKTKVGQIAASQITAADREQIQIGKVSRLDYLDNLPYNEINDPFLSNALRVYHLPKNNRIATLRQAVTISEYDKIVVSVGKPELTDITSRYPLLTHSYNYYNNAKADKLLYVNAKWASLQLKGSTK